jgi:hypothetical protein
MSMFNLFGKKKIKADELAPTYAFTIYQAIEAGFPEITGYLNEDTDFEEAPAINPTEDEWFIYIVFAGNLLHLEHHFPQEQVPDLTRIFAHQFTAMMGKDPLDDSQMIYDYIDYLKKLNQDQQSIAKSMALGLFRKYDLGKYQQEHFQKQDIPSPKVMKDLSDMVMYFLWNWEDYLSKYKVSLS